MPHEKIYLPNPYENTPPQDDATMEAAKLWKPQGLMVQWGPYGESDGAPAVGIGIGDYVESEEDITRVNGGKGKLEDMMMLWFARSQVNSAIRILRRARNGAYGTDE